MSAARSRNPSARSRLHRAVTPAHARTVAAARDRRVQVANASAAAAARRRTARHWSEGGAAAEAQPPTQIARHARHARAHSARRVARRLRRLTPRALVAHPAVALRRQSSNLRDSAARTSRLTKSAWRRLVTHIVVDLDHTDIHLERPSIPADTDTDGSLRPETATAAEEFEVIKARKHLIAERQVLRSRLRISIAHAASRCCRSVTQSSHLCKAEQVNFHRVALIALSTRLCLITTTRQDATALPAAVRCWRRHTTQRILLR